ncbi:MAG: serine/threonine protein kinase [Planctomycetia bacterium]|nr:serine/threonine protein kinase [Planctomycetia bacterium]
MGLLDSLKSVLSGGKVDVRSRYEFLREAISGTMSKFYMARDRQTGQIVGLKILDPEKTVAFESRFKGLKKPSEGEIIKSISHPHIVKVLLYGTTLQGEPFVVMEFLDGPGLNSLVIGRSPLLDGRRVKLIRQAAEALKAVHEAGYIHRDICPRNFMVAPDGENLKLIDFGLTVPATPPFMQPGNRTGTPNYMAPELVRRLATDQRLDVFAFGVSAYELCTFNLPWERGTTGQVAMTHAANAPADIRRYRPNINPTLAKAITWCIEQKPDKRCPSMEEFLRAIKDVKTEDV